MPALGVGKIPIGIPNSFKRKRPQKQKEKTKTKTNKYNHNGMDIEFMRLHVIGFDITLPNLFNCQFAVKELDVRFLKGENLFCRC